MLTSESFPEYFMNRGGFLDCDGGTRRFGDIETAMLRKGLAPHFFVQESCRKLTTDMLGSGYRRVDAMAVMSPERARFRRLAEVTIVDARGEALVDWSMAYLTSFYGDTRLLPAVLRVARAIGGRGERTFLAGRIGTKTAGVLALHRSPGLLGVYCVGTVPSFRERGVAAAMLEAAQRIGIAEGRQVVLQTILSDGYEDYYTKRGFRRLYLKNLLRKERRNRGFGEEGR
jgi:GNAT superfamily N-acetyltransferase